MPVIQQRNDHGELVARYDWPAGAVTPTASIHEALLKWRKEAIKEQVTFQGLAANTASIDREASKLMKSMAKEHLRMQRACTLMLPWFGPPDTAQAWVSPSLWPVELAEELDTVSGRVCLAFG